MANPPKAEELEAQQTPLLPHYPDDSDSTVSEEKIYTPPSAGSCSGESHADLHVEVDEEAHERARLLSSSPPPEYSDQAIARDYTHGDVKVDVKDAFVHEVESPSEEPDRRCGGKGRFCRWWKQRRDRCRRENGQCRGRSCCMKLLVFFKVALLVWLALWAVRWATIGFIRRHHRHHQHAGCGHPSNSSREIVVRESSSSIYGIYPLHDVLDLKTRSGSIFVTVVPQPADPNDPLRPARLSIKSRTGNVFVKFKMPTLDSAIYTLNTPDFKNGPATDDVQFDQMKSSSIGSPVSRQAEFSLPPRPYEIDIRTRSGNVFAMVGFSTHASISTRDGSINAHLTPFIFGNTTFPSDPNCKNCDDISIRTHTRSGDVLVSVTEPIFVASDEPEHKPEQASEENNDVAAGTKTLDTRRNHHNRPNRWSRILEALNGKSTHAASKGCGQSGLRANAYHTTRHSGSMSISYPKSWAGQVTAKARTPDNMLLEGDGLEVVDKSKNGRKVVAVKKPTVPRDDKKSWWGSEGDMGVLIKGRRASVKFNIRD